MIMPKAPAFLELRQQPHRWHEPKMVANCDHNPHPPAGIERRLRIGFAQGEWLFAIEVFPGRGDCFHLRAVAGVRGREYHGLNRFVGQNFIERSAKCNPPLGGEISHRFRFERDAADET
jgi:hypothetical protein